MIRIIYEDDYCLVVEKPNNMVVHHAKHSRNVLDELSLLQVIEKQVQLKCYPVHRLDRKTSGIILLAKQTEYVARFQSLFTENSIEKNYFGVVRGFSPETKVIDSPVKGRDAKVHKEALTHLKTIETVTLEIPVKPYDSSRYSLVKLEPKTGRMHQLRIHMNKISHPLIGDPKYGDGNHNQMFSEQFGWNHLFLHAASLRFHHPYLQKECAFNASFSKDWIALFNEFGWKNPLP